MKSGAPSSMRQKTKDVAVRRQLLWLALAVALLA